MKKKLLITGSSGFVGTNFIKRSAEFEIREVDLLVTRVKDIDFSGIDAVLHLAAMVHQMKGGNEEKYFKINRDLAFEMAEQSKLKGVRHFILLSTVKVYGESNFNDKILNEFSKCNPVDPYGKSKYEAEMLIQAIGDESFCVSVIRSPLIYGAGVKANMFNLIRLVDKYPLIPLGGITNKRSMVFIGNLIELITQILNKKECGIFLAGDKNSLSTTQLITLIAASLNKKIYLVKLHELLQKTIVFLVPKVADRVFGSFELDASVTNARLQFIPPFSISEGINEMVHWYQESQYGNKRIS